MKYLYFGILALLFSSCVHTQMMNQTAWPKMEGNSKILFDKIEGLSEHQSFEFFLLSDKYLKTSNNELVYLPEKEYDLINFGVSRDYISQIGSSDSLLQVIGDKLEVDYVIQITVNSLISDGSTLGIYTADDLNQYNAHYNQENEMRRAVLTFLVLGVNGEHRKFSVSTTIKPMSFSKKDGGENRVNVSSKQTALNIAYKKGLKKLKKEMTNE